MSWHRVEAASAHALVSFAAAREQQQTHHRAVVVRTLDEVHIVEDGHHDHVPPVDVRHPICLNQLRRHVQAVLTERQLAAAERRRRGVGLEERVHQLVGDQNWSHAAIAELLLQLLTWRLTRIRRLCV